MKRTAISIDEVLRKAALDYPYTEEGIACQGTAIEKRTIRVRDKAFLFLGSKDVMLKLEDSVAEANKLAKSQPEGLKIGKNGWVTVTLERLELMPKEVLIRWVGESYRLMAAKQANAKSGSVKAKKAKNGKEKSKS